MRAFLGWLRGEARHCRMAAIPTLAQEDAKRPSREHESLVARAHPPGQPDEGDAGPARPIRGFNIKLRQAAERLAALRTPEGAPLPPNTLAELRRDMARLARGPGADQGDRAGAAGTA